MDTAEFDSFGGEYQSLHARNIAVSGETPSFLLSTRSETWPRRCGKRGRLPRASRSRRPASPASMSAAFTLR